MDFIIDTCNAGSGTLAVTIDGPSKVAMDCTEVEEGYKVRYTPLTPGDYYIAVKYNGHHIAASPYKVKCTGEAIAQKGTVQESSSVVVETVAKINQQKLQHGPVMPHFTSDASKITSKGLGLKKANVGRANNFSLNAGVAGMNFDLLLFSFLVYIFYEIILFFNVKYTLILEEFCLENKLDCSKSFIFFNQVF